MTAPVLLVRIRSSRWPRLLVLRVNDPNLVLLEQTSNTTHPVSVSFPLASSSDNTHWKCPFLGKFLKNSFSDSNCLTYSYLLIKSNIYFVCLSCIFSCEGYTNLQLCSLLLAKPFQLLEPLQELSCFGEDQQALLCSLREVKFSFATLHLLQCPPHGRQVGQDGLRRVTKEKWPHFSAKSNLDAPSAPKL